MPEHVTQEYLFQENTKNFHLPHNHIPSSLSDKILTNLRACLLPDSILTTTNNMLTILASVIPFYDIRQRFFPISYPFTVHCMTPSLILCSTEKSSQLSQLQMLIPLSDNGRKILLAAGPNHFLYPVYDIFVCIKDKLLSSCC